MLQMRSGDFYLSVVEKYARTDQAVNLAHAETYVRVVCTRRVIDVLQRLLRPEISISSA
jgi:transposase-like protein